MHLPICPDTEVNSPPHSEQCKVEENLKQSECFYWQETFYILPLSITEYDAFKSNVNA